MLKIITALSILLFFSCARDQVEAKAKKDMTQRLVFPDVVVRTFSCAGKCTMSDANKAFDNSPDKKKIIQLISGAKKEIVLAQYVYLDSMEIMSKLLNAASRGVSIKVYADSENLDEKVPASITELVGTEKFRKASVQGRFKLLKGARDISEVNRLVALSYILNNAHEDNYVRFIKAADNKDSVFHVKFALFDNQFLIASTANWSFTGLGYSYELFAYYDLATSASIVRPFICAAKSLADDPMTLNTCSTDEVIFSNPNNNNKTFEYVNKAFKSAQKRIWVAGNQFGTDLFWKNPPGKSVSRLSEARVSPLDFRILTGNNICANHPRFQDYEKRTNIKIKCLPVNFCSYQQFHNKYFIIDDSVYFGSLNLDYDGLFNFWDYLIKDDRFLKRLEEHFSHLWSKSEDFEKVACHGERSCLKNHCVE